MEKTILHAKDDADCFGPTIKQAIEELTKILNGIDGNYRDKATIEFVSDYDTICVDYEVKYTRPESEQETQEREYRKYQNDKIRTDMERRQYEALKAKFGD